MPLVRVTTSCPHVLSIADEMAEALHVAVSEQLGKPDELTSVVVQEAKCMVINHKKQCVLVEIFAVGGDLSKLQNRINEDLVNLARGTPRCDLTHCLEANDIMILFEDKKASEVALGDKVFHTGNTSVGIVSRG